jgi:hypothetical protein
MNDLDRQIAMIFADHLHEQDPRFIWTPIPATEAADPTVIEPDGGEA